MRGFSVRFTDLAKHFKSYKLSDVGRQRVLVSTYSFCIGGCCGLWLVLQEKRGLCENGVCRCTCTCSCCTCSRKWLPKIGMLQFRVIIILLCFRRITLDQKNIWKPCYLNTMLPILIFVLLTWSIAINTWTSVSLLWALWFFAKYLF